MCFEFLTISSTQSARNSQRNQKRSKMQAVKGFFSSIKAGFASKGRTMGIVLGLLNPELSDFQNKKLLHEFHVFFDLNKDGILEWKDFDIARKKICELSGWKVGSEKYQQTNELFITIWRKLQDDGDENNDGKISTDEWLKMWSQFNEQCIKQSKKENEEAPERKLPDWLQQYIDYKFNLYDRTGDGHIDAEEFEYVLSDFGVPAKEARNSFLMFSCNNTKKVDRDYFKELCIDYYRSDDPSALGNFISGKLDFND